MVWLKLFNINEGTIVTSRRKQYSIENNHKYIENKENNCRFHDYIGSILLNYNQQR